MQLPNIKLFKKYKEKNVVITEEGERLPGVTAKFFKRKKAGREESIGVFSYKGQKLYSAWGYIDEPHCRLNAVTKDNDIWYAARNGCPQIKTKKDKKRTVGFTIKTKQGTKTFSLR